MESGKPSYMADRTARLRAAHQLLDDDPKILADPLAVSLYGGNTESDIQEDLEFLQKPVLRRARTFMVVRARYTEDQLTEAIKRGIEQFVILGAGLDTFAYRCAESVKNLRIFEVDHPDTQRWKLAKLKAAQIGIPAHLRHIGVDFEHHSLADKLTAGGFDAAAPAFFSWLGVSYYLERHAVFSMFAFIANMPPPSQIVFDYLLDETLLDEKSRASVSSARRQTDTHGEPLRTRFVPRDLQAELQKIGFRKVARLTSQDATQLYLSGRRDGLSLDASLQLMSAIV